MGIILKLTVGSTTVVNRGLDHTWAVIRRLGKDGATFSACDVCRASNDSRGTISEFLRRLSLAGFVRPAGETVGPKGVNRKLWLLMQSPARRPIVTRTGGLSDAGKSRQQAWNFMRGPMSRQGFTLADLTVYATTSEVAVTLAAARSFVRGLKQGGYLVDLGGRPKQWRLKPSMNTGPLPPAALESQVVFDRNRNMVFGDIVAREAGQ
ncbi:hypothetical protein ASD44_09825 [Mesorhizobium sp. Root554]|uniref:hypothetical protein n=2 Tax=unclassified Mesorhizobium TaxID=325217 RepID=UPI0006F68D16|nr:hypothetical protein [Mesorhizobium sp. Root554]KQZ14337.1 hypothetical protein ASD27_09835 [Mesorhizobium sp. Root1471]KQZ36848.1 hypothetical protein ASD44_09825 [Mesorhizobium sp. Root554]